MFGKFFYALFIFEKDGEIVSRGGAEREGDTESVAGSRLWAVSTESNVGLEPMSREIMTWAEVRGLTDWAIQALLNGSKLISITYPDSNLSYSWFGFNSFFSYFLN